MAVDCNQDGIEDAVELQLRKVELAAVSSHPVGVTPRTVVVEDLNLDGRSDVLALVPEKRGVSYWLHAGQGRLEPERRLPVGGTPRGAAIADFDGDGFPEVATANAFGTDRLPNSVVILKNVAGAIHRDCDGDSILDHCEVASGAEQDCNFDGVLDPLPLGRRHGRFRARRHLRRHLLERFPLPRRPAAADAGRCELRA